MKFDPDLLIACLCTTVLCISAILAYSLDDKPQKTKLTPIAEIRCSDLERVYEECESAKDVALCRGRYTIKIAACFGVK